MQPSYYPASSEPRVSLSACASASAHSTQLPWILPHSQQLKQARRWWQLQICPRSAPGMRLDLESYRCTRPTTQNACNCVDPETNSQIRRMNPNSQIGNMNPNSQIGSKSRNWTHKNEIGRGITKIWPSPALACCRTWHTRAQDCRACRTLWHAASGARYGGNPGTSSSALDHIAASGIGRMKRSTSAAAICRRSPRRRGERGGRCGQRSEWWRWMAPGSGGSVFSC